MKYQVGEKLEPVNFFKGVIEILGIIPIGSRNGNKSTIYILDMDGERLDLTETILDKLFNVYKAPVPTKAEGIWGRWVIYQSIAQ